MYPSTENIEIFKKGVIQMAYIDRNLTKGETVVLRARPSMFGLVFAWVLTVAVAIIAFIAKSEIGENSEMVGIMIGISVGIVAIILLIKAIKLTISFICAELALTNKRVIGKSGFMTSGSVDLPLDKVQSISVSSKFLGKIFNSGNILSSLNWSI